MNRSTSKGNPNRRFLLRNVFIITIGLLINQLLQTAGSIVLARVLDNPVTFGEVNLLLQIFGMVGLFLNVGFTSALVYSFSVDPEEARQTRLRLALVGSVFFAVLTALLLTLASPLLARAYSLPALTPALQISSLQLLFTAMVNLGVASFSGKHEFGAQAFFMVLTTLFQTAGTILGVVTPIGKDGVLSGVSLWMAAGALATAAIISWKMQRVHRPQWLGTLSLRTMREMMAYGVPIWAGNIFKAFQQPFLVMMIGSGSVVAVGYLTNGLRITGFIGIITWAFMIVTFPFVAESSQDIPESKRRGALCIRYNNFLLYPLTLLICLFPGEISGFLFGASYAAGDSPLYIRLLALGVFFSSVGRLGGNILSGMNRTKANFWVMVAAGALVVAIVPFIAARHPLLAVWVYTGSWGISALFTIWFFYYEGFVLDWRTAFLEPLLPTAVMGALLELGRLTGGHGFLLFLAAGLAALVALTWRSEKRSTVALQQ